MEVTGIKDEEFEATGTSLDSTRAGGLLYTSLNMILDLNDH